MSDKVSLIPGVVYLQLWHIRKITRIQKSSSLPHLLWGSRLLWIKLLQGTTADFFLFKAPYLGFGKKYIFLIRCKKCTIYSTGWVWVNFREPIKKHNKQKEKVTENTPTLRQWGKYGVDFSASLSPFSLSHTFIF